MNEQIDAILARIRGLEDELEREVEKGRAVYGPAIKENVAEFEQDVLTRHRRLKMGLVQFFRETPLLNVLTSPVIYSLGSLSPWWTSGSRYTSTSAFAPMAYPG